VGTLKIPLPYTTTENLDEKVYFGRYADEIVNLDVDLLHSS
jgi:hypothetical protein